MYVRMYVRTFITSCVSCGTLGWSTAEHCWMRGNCWTATARRWGICQRRWAGCCSPLASEGTIQGSPLTKETAGSGATGKRYVCTYVRTYSIFNAMRSVGFLAGCYMNSKWFFYTNYVESRLKTLPSFQAECFGLLKGKDA